MRVSVAVRKSLFNIPKRNHLLISLNPDQAQKNKTNPITALNDQTSERDHHFIAFPPLSIFVHRSHLHSHTHHAFMIFIAMGNIFSPIVVRARCVHKKLLITQLS
jgi:hypothetical protein